MGGPTVPDRAVVGESDIERAIRHAVYLTGGLVLLAVGTLEVSSILGELASCLDSGAACFGGVIYYTELPELGGGLFLVAVAAILLVLAYRTRRPSPPSA